VKTIATGALFLLMVLPLLSQAEIDPDSPFPAERNPASQLDVALLKIERDWNHLYLSGLYPEGKYSWMMRRAGLHLKLYRRESNTAPIGAIVSIFNVEGFLTLTEKEREQLLKQIASNLISDLSYYGVEYDDDPRSYNSYNPDAPEPDRKVKLGDLFLSIKTPTVENVRRARDLDDPMKFYFLGQAGMSLNKLYMSVPYYLKLQVEDGAAVQPPTDELKDETVVITIDRTATGLKYR